MNQISSSVRSYTDQGLLFLRLCLGVIFFFHGYPMLLSGPETWIIIGSAMSNFGVSFYPEFWGFLASLAELAGGICLLLGVFFKPVSLVLAITMAVAFSSHLVKGDPFEISSHSLTTCIIFVTLFFTGPGKFTVLTNPTKGSGD